MSYQDKTREQLIEELKMLHQRIEHLGTAMEAEENPKTGEVNALGTLQDATERKQMEETLRESEPHSKRKIERTLPLDSDLGELELSDIIDVEAVQALMDNFYELTNIGIAIVNMEGKVLIATGWQDICTKFHRVHPQTRQHCIESDTILSSGVEPGTYRLYKCKNNMWDMATPIVVGGRHVGNLFLGQFFFTDEKIDREMFRRQAQKYGFDEEAYLAALDRVPRWPQEIVETVFRFYARFAEMISQLSHSNLKLARALTEKNRSLKARRESERKFKSYIEHAPYGVFVTDDKGRYVEVNETACRMTGYEREELLNLRIVQLAPPDQRRLVEEHFQTAVEEGVAVSEKPFVTRDGHIRWWLVTTVRLSEDRFLGYKKDITERKQAEEMRRLNRYRLEALLDLGRMKDASIKKVADFVLDKAIHLTESEMGFLGFISEDEEQMIIHAWSEAVMAECQINDKPLYFPIDDAGIWAEAIRQRRPLIFNEYTDPHPEKKGCPDGHVSLTRLLSVPISDDGSIVAIAAVANKKEHYDEVDLHQIQLLADGLLRLIHEREAEEALRESEERYRSLYRSIRDAILVASTDREIINCNPAFTELFGYTLDEIKGRKTLVIYENEEEFNRLGEAIKEHWGDSNFFFTVNYRKKSGEVFPGETNVFNLQDDEGEIQGVIGLIRDITKRRQAEAQIQNYAAELERSNRELEQFGYVVSHDLQSPLRVVKGYLKLLNDLYGDQLEAKAEGYITHAVDGAKRMQEMINALLELSRVETQGNELALTDVEAVLEHTLEALGGEIDNAEAEITHDPLPAVMADRVQLRQVFQNLIANGIKFHKDDVQPRVHISAEQKGDKWQFSIEDNGIGIDPKQTVHLFHVFQRLRTEKEYPGLGIGLALCKRIVKRHGGRIWIDSELGEGSTFFFTIPVRGAEI